MKNFLEYIFNQKKDIPKMFVLSLIFLIVVGMYIYNITYYVIVRFDELGPVSKNMAVYYNGFKVGKIVSIEPDNDFSHTLVKVNLNMKKLKLPQNTTVQMKSFLNGELYLDLIYPQTVSLKQMKRGDILEGTSPYSLEEFMLGQNVSGVTDIVSIHVIKALNAMQLANMEMEVFFNTTSLFMKENKKGLNASVENTETMTKNLAEAAENINQATKKINKALDDQVLKDTSVNFKDSTKNLKETTESISKATKDFDKTMQKVDETVSHVNSAAKNIECITTGLNETLSKRFGGARVIFGTPVKQKN